MAKSAAKTHFWSDTETEFMLGQLKELNILKYMDGRKTRNGNLFKKVAERMDGEGFERTPEQVRVRWKHLKQAYYNAKKPNRASGPGPDSGPHADILEELLGCRPSSQTGEQHGVDIGFSASVSGFAIADASTSSSSSSEFDHRKRPSPANGDAIRRKEAKTKVLSGPATTDNSVQTLEVLPANVKELFEMMVQSVTTLASSLASSYSSSQPTDQLTLQQPDLQQRQAHCSPSRSNHLKMEDEEAVVKEFLDQTDNDMEEEFSTSTRLTQAKRKSSDTLLEECLQRMEAREAQRNLDLDQRDDVTLFLLSLAPAMRRLSAEKQSLVRTKIQQLLHEAEFGVRDF
ncbi:uncharacterized protein LOC115038088 [Echeneis naucrates]|uniref:uncharacterized protein LOC115038088 n=1 Tax=Echeneis naucrates TaxID=173247 RepID=UPI0011136BD5|nr:uncharacterized protein LOC115038088 [Echeneis naucrates]